MRGLQPPMAWALHSEVVHQDFQGDVVALLVEPRANLPHVRKECGRKVGCPSE